VKSTFSLRGLVAAVIGLLGCSIIWVVVPYNNFLLNNTYLADSFLPESVVAILMLLVLLVNPLLRLISARLVLTREQVALICGMMLFGAIIPSNGLMRMFPRYVAEMNREMHATASTARIVAESDFRQALFPDPLPVIDADGQLRTVETVVSDQFINELYEGESIPWRAWVVPMAAWGMLIMALWMMMIGLGGVVYPQWRDQERLPFPLLNVYHALIGETDDDTQRILPAVFYSRAFWIGCIVVFIIHGFRGLSIFTSGGFPSFPLQWNLSEYFTDGIMRHASLPLKFQVIFFSVVGVAYFIPSRYAISIWGLVVAYAWYITIGNAYIPAFQAGQVESQAFGALLSIAVWVLWLGRSHWYRVGQAMFGRAVSSEESRRNAIAGWMFVLGCAGIVLWLLWAGAALWWSILAMFGCAIVALLMARIIAETGVPVLWMGRMSVVNLTALFPLAWQSPVILLFTGVFSAILTRTTAVSAAVISTLAMGLDRTAKPSRQTRFLIGGVLVLAIGFMICGAVHLRMGYGSAEITTQAKTGISVVNQWARVDRVGYDFFTNQRWHQFVGLSGAMGLLVACSRFPAWPIHPVGILFVRISIGNLLWFSVFLGWLLKTFVTRLFGGGAYRKARPLFLGLIIGELLAIMVWALVPVLIMHFTGAMHYEVPRYILMQYP
jgi:hypothetical protein